MGGLEHWILDLASSPWVYVILFLLATIDGFFPPLPSESVIIALVTLSVSTGEPKLGYIGIAAALGAFTGDQIAYTIGHRIQPRRLRLFRKGKGKAALDWAEDSVTRRGPVFIIAARYVPVGRVAVNMTAGSIPYPRRRFSLLVAIAATSWAGYSMLLGIGAGRWLGDYPLIAIVVGVAAGLVLGLLIDRILRAVGVDGRTREPAGSTGGTGDSGSQLAAQRHPAAEDEEEADMDGRDGDAEGPRTASEEQDLVGDGGDPQVIPTTTRTNEGETGKDEVEHGIQAPLSHRGEDGHDR